METYDSIVLYCAPRLADGAAQGIGAVSGRCAVSDRRGASERALESASRPR